MHLELLKLLVNCKLFLSEIKQDMNIINDRSSYFFPNVNNCIFHRSNHHNYWPHHTSMSFPNITRSHIYGILYYLYNYVLKVHHIVFLIHLNHRDNLWNHHIEVVEEYIHQTSNLYIQHQYSHLLNIGNLMDHKLLKLK